MGSTYSIKNKTYTDLELKANGKTVCNLMPGQTVESCKHTLSMSVMLTVLRNTDGSSAKRRVLAGATIGSCNKYYITHNFEGGKSEIMITG